MIPDTELKLNVGEWKKLPLKYARLFEKEGFSLTRMIEFLSKYSNWTAEQLDELPSRNSRPWPKKCEDS